MNHSTSLTVKVFASIVFILLCSISHAQDTVYVFGTDTMNTFDPLVYKTIDTNEVITSSTEKTTYLDTIDVEVYDNVARSFTAMHNGTTADGVLHQLNNATTADVTVTTPDTTFVINSSQYNPNPFSFSLAMDANDVLTVKMTNNIETAGFDLEMSYNVTSYDTIIVISLDSLGGDTNNTSINQPNLIGFSLYPNPVINFINVEFDVIPNNATFQITSMNGSVVKKGTVAKKIDVTELETGLYLIHLDIDGVISTNRFIKRF